MLKVVLSCSLLTNCVFALLLAREPVRRPSAPAHAPVAPVAVAPPTAGPASRGAADGEPYGRLLALGLEPAQAKTLLRAELERDAAAQVPPPPDDYWRSGPEARAAHALAVLAAEDRVRDRLRRLFGASAERDPSFASLFRPLDPYLPFLDSGEQLALRRFQLERQAAAAAAAASAETGILASAGSPQSPRAEGPALDDALRPESLLEYELRESPLAVRLRAAANDLSEQAFREAFLLLRDIDAGHADVRDHVEARAALLRLLGPRAFARLWSARDPFFVAVADVAQRYGWSDETTLDAYSLLARHEEALLAAIADRASDAELVARETRRLSEDVQRSLAALVGDGAAAALLQARAERSFMADRTGFSPRNTGR